MTANMICMLLRALFLLAYFDFALPDHYSWLSGKEFQQHSMSIKMHVCCRKGDLKQYLLPRSVARLKVDQAARIFLLASYMG